MACDHMEALAYPTVGHRDPGVGKGRNGRRHAGDHLIGDPMGREALNLLSAPAKDKGISALQTDHPLSL